MRILRITHQYRRDFTAITECEHCGHTETLKNSYDDDYYHRNVIPKMKCKKCGKKANDDYRPMGTKYKTDKII